MANRRGRPSKFGRPARTVVLTLPENVLAQLRSIHHDLAWAVVSLAGRPAPAAASQPSPAPPARLVDVSGKQALIVVNPTLLRRVDGVSIIPLADGRGLISLAVGKGAADLELSVLDRLDRIRRNTAEYRELQQLRGTLRRWRSGRGLRFRTRSIIVVERAPASELSAGRSGNGSPALPPADRILQLAARRTSRKAVR
jgi:hypothetical protein